MTLTASNLISPKDRTDNPEAHYRDPDHLRGDPRLSSGQKRAAIEAWAFIVRSRLDAMSEGMNNVKESAYTADVALMQKLEKLLESRCDVRVQKAQSRNDRSAQKFDQFNLRNPAAIANNRKDFGMTHDHRPVVDKPVVLGSQDARQGWIGTGRVLRVLLISMALVSVAAIFLWVFNKGLL